MTGPGTRRDIRPWDTGNGITGLVWADYSSRPLNRLTTAFRIILAITIMLGTVNGDGLQFTFPSTPTAL